MKQFRIAIVYGFIAAAFCLVAPGVQAQANPRIGVWKLDLARSTYQQGKAPASETRTYLATEDGGLQLTADIILPSGTKQPAGYRAKYDGKDYPYSGPAGQTIAITGDGWASDSTIKSAGKVAQVTHSVISKDGTTMTMTTKTGAGFAVSTRVYTKQK